jgi:16S rRNA (adenine1518-N6/adenine1519-N6)-dimethyltransferase
MQHVQTKREITGMLAAAGVRPRKRFGQHFLIDGNLMRRLVESAELEPSDCVLEVGAGTGGLTDLIVGRVRELICVEIDRDLYVILEDRFREASGVTLIRGDVLESKHRLMDKVDRAVRGGNRDGCVKLVANLPYQVATPLVMNLLLDYRQMRRLAFTLQREVADRITAQPNRKAYGPLSILSQSLCEIKQVAKISPEAFWPRPTVGSSMIRMDVGKTPFGNRDELRGFAALVRATFDHRRKTLRSALGYAVSEQIRDRICEHVDATRRPESFTVEEWLDIYRNCG